MTKLLWILRCIIVSNELNGLKNHVKCCNASDMSTTALCRICNKPGMVRAKPCMRTSFGGCSPLTAGCSLSMPPDCIFAISVTRHDVDQGDRCRACNSRVSEVLHETGHIASCVIERELRSHICCVGHYALRREYLQSLCCGHVQAAGMKLPMYFVSERAVPCANASWRQNHYSEFLYEKLLSGFDILWDRWWVLTLCNCLHIVINFKPAAQLIHSVSSLQQT